MDDRRLKMLEKVGATKKDTKPIEKSLIERLIEELGTTDQATLMTFKDAFDGIKVVHDAEHPYRWVDGMTPINNAFYLKDDGKIYVYMDGNWAEWEV